ncbi:MAG: hypothetical protein IKV45_05750 [Firmicutes bacterium]|nr:hypothetical protein [Bacillota bacterium]
MIYLVIVAVIGVLLFVFTQTQKRKHTEVEKDALHLAWEKKDYDAYLAIINEKIKTSKNKKEKNVLATLKMQVYVLQKDWAKMDALKAQVKMAMLPKKIRVTFLSQYIIGLCLADRPREALKWMEVDAQLLKEAENNGTYKLYIDTLKGLKAFYQNDLDEAKAIFLELRRKNIPGDLYNPLYKDYLERIRTMQSPAEITE